MKCNRKEFTSLLYSVLSAYHNYLYSKFFTIVRIEEAMEETGYDLHLQHTKLALIMNDLDLAEKEIEEAKTLIDIKTEIKKNIKEMKETYKNFSQKIRTFYQRCTTQ